MNTLHESIKKCLVDGNTVYLPVENLANYADVKKALQNAGGVYNRNKFVFKSEAQPLIDRILDGDRVNIKTEFQFYETPDDLADRIVDMAFIHEDNTVLEPSAGQGALVKAVQRRIPGKTVYCLELMPENRVVLETIPGVHFLGAKNHLAGSDFMEFSTTGFFDRIIANPPFTKNQDIDHIRKMYSVLNKNGRLVSMASLHWKHSSQKKETEFRTWLDDVNAEIYPVEAGKFKKSGTSVATVMIVINK